MKSLPVLLTLMLPISAAEPNMLTAEEKEAGFKLLFDGKSLDGFRGFKKEAADAKWQVKDGTIVLTEGGAGDLITSETFESFEFRFEFKIAAHGNSGIMWHVSEDGNHPYESGPEYQILDSLSTEGYEHERKVGNVSGAFYGIIPAAPEISKPAGEWNEGIIRVEGAKVTLSLNGKVTADIDISGEKYKELLAKSKFATWEKFNKTPKGHFAFQDHGNVVAFRSLRILELP